MATETKMTTTTAITATGKPDLRGFDDLLGPPKPDVVSPSVQPTAAPVTSAPAAESVAFNPAGEFIDPITGEIVDTKDIDGLIDSYERICNLDSSLYVAKQRIRESLAALSEGPAKTRRVQGHRRKAKVEMPADSWDQTKLKQIWEMYPDLRGQALKIDSIGVKLTEYKKLVNTTGTPELEAFRDNVTSANKGPTVLATIKIES